MTGAPYYDDPAWQTSMLLDQVRVDAFARAIAATVRPGDVVLDAGSGSGILALLAARAGARRVIAVERTTCAELARAHAADNGFADVIEVIRADLSAVQPDAFPEPPRVVISETLGSFAPEEQLHEVFATARRLARPDAVLIPSSYRLILAAAHPLQMQSRAATLGALHGCDLRTLARIHSARVADLALNPTDLLGPEAEWAPIAVDAPTPEEYAGEVAVATDGEVTAIATSFAATLAPGIELRTSVAAPSTHWRQVVFPVDPPLVCRAGDTLRVSIRPRRVDRRRTYLWSVARGDDLRFGDGMNAFLGSKGDVPSFLGMGLTGSPAVRRSRSRRSR